MNKKAFITIPVGFLEVNCYLVPSDADRCLYIIDPGADADEIVRAASEFKFPETKILLTHGHVDHIGAVRTVMESLRTSQPFLHEHDFPLYFSPANSVMPWLPPVTNPPRPCNSFTGSEFRILHTPGHSRGCVCFFSERLKALFSGDTIFRESVGRTDLPGGDHGLLIKSITEKIFALDDGTGIFPGHGGSTSVGDEKKYNPFISDFQ